VIPAWKTIDRVLDVLFWFPGKREIAKKGKASKKKGNRKSRARSRDALSNSDGSDDDPQVQAEYAAAFDDGEQPSEDLTETIEEFEEREGRGIVASDIDRVIWIFAKWCDLGYDECPFIVPFTSPHS